MTKAGQMILTIGALMLAAGFTLPYFVGSGTISPLVYNLLQIGGIVLALVGYIVRRRGKASEIQASV
jgi:hypothetical protein